MAALFILKGPGAGQSIPLPGDANVIGRQPDVGVYLDSLAVSRQHARVVCEDGAYFLEDLGSSNGTYLNGQLLSTRASLSPNDTVQIGPYSFALRLDEPVDATTPEVDTQHVVRATVEAQPSNRSLFARDPAYKLQVILEIAQHLGRTMNIEDLLGQLLDHLLRLFPQADRGLALMCEGDKLALRAQRGRAARQTSGLYSKTIVNRVLTEGVGLWSEDVGSDRNLQLSATMVSLQLRSFLCAPLIGAGGKRLGVLQLDTSRVGHSFQDEDLEVFTAIALQVSVVLENVSLHAELLREARLRQELLLAREIQQAFLPSDFSKVADGRVELFARMQPAREVSGDLYDCFRLGDGRVAFYLGDVSGKGMPAALFMIAVRTLTRQLAAGVGEAATGPADLLQRLNAALVADNPTNLYVTLVVGMYDPATGKAILASGGHPPPLVRRTSGEVEVISVKPAVMLGCAPLRLAMNDTAVTLQPGETLVCYTDGFTEAFAPDGKTMFGLDSLREVLGGPRTELSLQQCADEATAAIRRFTGQDELQDDQTLLLLRRLA